MTVRAHYVKMKETRKGCDEDDRNLVLTYFRSESYWMGSILYKIFIDNGWCEDATPSEESPSVDETIDKEKEAMKDKKEEKDESEEKGKRSAPQNKAAFPKQNK